jgi:hypothetical protein
MLFGFLHRIGVPSDLFYFASLGSIATSVVAWSPRKQRSSANAERLGIFVGLWAPTFMLIGHGIQQIEVQRGRGSPVPEATAHRADEAADEARRNEASVKP